MSSIFLFLIYDSSEYSGKESSVGYIREAVQSLLVTLPTLEEYSHSTISLYLFLVCRLLSADFCTLPLPPVPFSSGICSFTWDPCKAAEAEAFLWRRTVLFLNLEDRVLLCSQPGGEGGGAGTGTGHDQSPYLALSKVHFQVQIHSGLRDQFVLIKILIKSFRALTSTPCWDRRS